jgi:hypothetical protein
MAEHATTGEGGIWRLAAALSGAVTTKDVAEATAEYGAGAAGCDFMSFAMVDADAGRIWLRNYSGLVPEVAARWQDLPLDETSPLGAALVRRTPVFRGGLNPDGDEFFPLTAGDREAAGFRATAAFPLVGANGSIVGGVGLAWKEAQHFDPEQVARLSLITEVIAQATDRAMLYEREEASLSAVQAAQVSVMQEAIVPSRLPSLHGLDVAAAYLPIRGAPMGGDWYDAFPVQDGAFLSIGDVAGHGLRSVAVMAQLRNAIRAYATDDPTPARVLTKLNTMLCRLEPDATATALVARWEPNTPHPLAGQCWASSGAAVQG